MKQTLNISLFTALMLSVSSSAQADNFNAYLEALNNHPLLKAEYAQGESYKYTSKSALALPDPMIELGLNNYPADFNDGFNQFSMSSKSIGFTQAIPNSAVREGQSKALMVKSEASSLHYAYQKQKLYAELVSTLLDMKRIEKQKKLLNKERKLLNQEADYWGGRLQSGSSTLDERVRVDANLAELDARMASLNAEGVVYTAKLKQLTGFEKYVSPNYKFNMQDEGITYPVVLAEKAVKVELQNIEKTDAAFNPDYKLGVKYSQRSNSESFDGQDFLSANIGFTIPLWYSDKQQPNLRAAKALHEKAKLNLENTKRTWAQKMKALEAYIQQSFLTMKSLRSKVKAIQARINTLESSYEADGRLDVLIASERSLLGVNYALEEQMTRYKKLIAEYNSHLVQEGK